MREVVDPAKLRTEKNRARKQRLKQKKAASREKQNQQQQQSQQQGSKPQQNNVPKQQQVEQKGFGFYFQSLYVFFGHLCTLTPITYVINPKIKIKNNGLLRYTKNTEQRNYSVPYPVTVIPACALVFKFKYTGALH